MAKRITLEIDEELLARAKQALGAPTTRATVEQALKRAAEGAVADRVRRAAKQLRYLDQVGQRADLSVLASPAMWR